MKNKIVENLSFIVIAATLILIAVFNKNGQAMLYIGAVGASIYGVLAGINRERYGAVSLGAGLSLLVTIIFIAIFIISNLDKDNNVNTNQINLTTYHLSYYCFYY